MTTPSAPDPLWRRVRDVVGVVCTAAPELLADAAYVAAAFLWRPFRRN